MRKLAMGLGLLVLVGWGVSGLLPERYAVNAPVLNNMLGWQGAVPSEATFAERIELPDGFSIGVWASGLRNARFLRVTPSGDILVSRPREGAVTLLHRDADGDGTADGRTELLEGLNRPHGLDLWDGWLYVAETDAVGRIRFDPEARATRGDFERVVTGLPAGGSHWTRTVAFGPDGGMYVAVGSSCNVCVEEDERRAALLRFEPDGSGGEIYATGLRNTVGLAWRPATGELYGTDNGRDLLGDDFPPCELNRIERGKFYGWPFANGFRVVDPDLGAGRETRVRESVPPAHGFGAHTAPLGITFLSGEGWPPAYRGAALVALHGSWNRTRKSGYEVVSLHWTERGISERPFVRGFELDEDVIGRPVDVVEGPDGAAYISDDYTGSVYRVVYGDGSAGTGGAATTAAAVGDPLAGLSEREREERVTRGRALYEESFCAQCHEGLRAQEGVIVVPLANLGARYGVTDLMAFLAAPTPPMPALELTDEQRRDLSVYLLAAYP